MLPSGEHGKHGFVTQVTFARLQFHISIQAFDLQRLIYIEKKKHAEQSGTFNEECLEDYGSGRLDLLSIGICTET